VRESHRVKEVHENAIKERGETATVINPWVHRDCRKKGIRVYLRGEKKGVKTNNTPEVAMSKILGRDGRVIDLKKTTGEKRKKTGHPNTERTVGV